MSSQEFGWTAKDGLSIYAKRWMPDGEPRAVIALVHGLGEHVNRYQHVCDFYNQNGIGVVGMDLRGHGKTPGVRGHADSYDIVMDDIDHLIEEAKTLANGKPVILYGHSMGGSLVLYYVLSHKPAIAGLICTSPGLPVPEMIAGSKLFLAKTMNTLFPKFTVDNGLDLNGLARDPEVIAKYKADPLVHGMISARMGMEMMDKSVWIRSRPQELTLPTLLMQGTADRLVSPEVNLKYAKELGTNVTVKVWEGYYHELHNEPEKAAVLQFELDWLNHLIK